MCKFVVNRYKSQIYLLSLQVHYGCRQCCSDEKAAGRKAKAVVQELIGKVE
jgi:hypothetical protein